MTCLTNGTLLIEYVDSRAHPIVQIAMRAFEMLAPVRNQHASHGTRIGKIHLKIYFLATDEAMSAKRK
jgi:hypothetical protein